jgi:hypothetical protein
VKKLPHPPKDHTQLTVLFMLALGLVIASLVSIKKLHDIQVENRAGSADPDSSSLASCDHDSETFCSGMPLGDPATIQCLGRHLNQLTTSCSEYVERVDSPDDWNNVCQNELQGICSGRSRKIECLREHRSALSSRCLDLLTSYDHDARWHNACYDDATRLCSNAPFDEVHSKSCLQNHTSDLSIGCRAYYATP